MTIKYWLVTRDSKPVIVKSMDRSNGPVAIWLRGEDHEHYAGRPLHEVPWVEWFDSYSSDEDLKIGDPSDDKGPLSLQELLPLLPDNVANGLLRRETPKQLKEPLYFIDSEISITNPMFVSKTLDGGVTWEIIGRANNNPSFFNLEDPWGWDIHCFEHNEVFTFNELIPELQKRSPELCKAVLAAEV